MSQVNPENFPKEDIKLKSKIGRIVAIGVLTGVIIASGQKNAGETDNELDSMISDNTLEVLKSSGITSIGYEEGFERARIYGSARRETRYLCR